ncbi:TEL2-interacting protein-like protein [Hapsidospora chrysogenum ATCC 11550]|uniref:TEL2-interacting protein-like protein n=1 Tax=Hapsidospora chrysogenum (strain ATCC 11550 / CBS 779.69 / DSM 880 / IAM 14645 / JCM 23072 / IMI 49137) TaxID=857340 RepID=A0A086SXG3_HAPC1|nr:TEL2-interacting protein-like protein [Hapsidospora chrysogenum ATCC 11550]
MDSTPSPQDRNELFQKLKPCCVKISQLAIKEPGSQATHRELLGLTNQVLDVLHEQTRSRHSALDEKLAEYVFFPLYHIFRQLDLFPILLVENCVKCLNVLIIHGWKAKIPPKMVQQILTLLTFIIDGVPGSEKKRHVPEETVLESFRTLTSLFKVSSISPTAAAALAGEDAIPALGHGITVMLDGVSKGTTDSIQQEALHALQGVYSTLRDQAALANFLPGTISAMTKIISTPARYRKLVLSQCLATVSLVLTRVLGDMQTRSIQAKSQSSASNEQDKNKLLSPAWLKATTGQVRLALTTMMKLRTHDAPEVRGALRSLCVKLLDECHTTLADCAPFLVETAMVLDDKNIETSLAETSLRNLISIYPELADKAKSAVYSWMSSLPRVMQSGDEDVKRNAVHNLSKGIGLLQELHIESETLEDALSDALRDSTVALMTSTKSHPKVSTMDVVTLGGEQSMTFGGIEQCYNPVLLAHESQRAVRQEILGLLRVIGSHTKPSRLVTDMLEHVRIPGSINRIAAFWLCFELVKAAHSSSADEATFLDLSAFAGSDDDVGVAFQELYSYSVQVLDSHAEAEAADWRLEALALEVTSYAASRSGAAFRPELIDVLFPIVTFMGSENQELRQHAIVTLNAIASACEYDSVSALIIENVDYMVNSVALRLNTLDISPASTQVLTMMIRLTGPRLVPFLDDVVESIFAALENYHGYPLFVESLFSVLKELVNQAVKSDTLLLEDQKHSVRVHKKKRPQPEGIGGLLEFLERRKKRKKYEEEEEKSNKASQGHPTEPWKEGPAEGDDDDDDEQGRAPPPEREKPPNTVTYQLLLRITSLTQHYLTSPTPKLRRSLLELLSTASPALAADEDSFLPLVNAIWPVVVSRLYDPESFIAIEACHALAALCAAAGDFLSSRFKTEWSDGLGDWCRKVKHQVLAGTSRAAPPSEPTSMMGGGRDKKILIPTAAGTVVESRSGSGQQSREATSGSLGQYSSPVRLWEAVVKLLTSLVSHVRVSDEMFDEILDLLAEVLERSSEVREALETVNPDAVWLVRYERGCVERLPTPKMEGVVFVSMNIGA